MTSPGRNDVALPAKLRVVGEIGRGGMGVVLDAVDETLGRRVAVKVLSAESSDAVSAERLLREARAAATLESPHVVRVFEVGRLDNGQLFVVMERLEGETLEARLARAGPLAIDDARRFAREALAGLGEAHRRGLVHRDIKPGNLFVAREAHGGESLKILDFGLVRDTQGASALTGPSEGLGTPAYMAPEQIRSARDVDARADVWSMGATLYELYTGKLPFPADTVIAMLTRILAREPVPIQTLRPDLPDALASVIMRCLAKDPDARYPHADALDAALAATEPVAAPPAPAPEPERRPGRRTWLFVAAVASTVALGALAAFGFAPGRPRAAVPIAVDASHAVPSPPPIEDDASTAEPVDAATEDAAALASPAAPRGPRPRSRTCSCRARENEDIVLCREGWRCVCVATEWGAESRLSMQLGGGEQLYTARQGSRCIGFPVPGSRAAARGDGSRIAGTVRCERCVDFEPALASSADGQRCSGFDTQDVVKNGTVRCTR